MNSLSFSHELIRYKDGFSGRVLCSYEDDVKSSGRFKNEGWETTAHHMNDVVECEVKGVTTVETVTRGPKFCNAFLFEGSNDLVE